MMRRRTYLCTVCARWRRHTVLRALDGRMWCAWCQAVTVCRRVRPRRTPPEEKDRHERRLAV